MIIVVGCARSGTSLTASVLQACGANFGTNIDELFEHKYIRGQMIKPYLIHIGADPRGISPLPNIDNIIPFNDFGARVVSAIEGPNPLAYKCPKSCHIWPIWKEHFPHAKWVLVRRKKKQIVDSCIRTKFMQGLTERDQWEAWVDVHNKRLRDIAVVAGVENITVWPQRGLHNPEFWKPLIEHCGLTWNYDEVARRIDPSLWHV